MAPKNVVGFNWTKSSMGKKFSGNFFPGAIRCNGRLAKKNSPTLRNDGKRKFSSGRRLTTAGGKMGSNYFLKFLSVLLVT